MFIFLLALGEDYNILVMTRIREEAHDRPLREAVVRAVGRTGPTVTSAGLVLAGTFVVLAVAGGSGPGGSEIRAIGFGLAVGILMDTFLVRTLLVPATVALLGRWNWWPSRLARTATRSSHRSWNAAPTDRTGDGDGAEADRPAVPAATEGDEAPVAPAWIRQSPGAWPKTRLNHRTFADRLGGMAARFRSPWPVAVRGRWHAGHRRRARGHGLRRVDGRRRVAPPAPPLPAPRGPSDVWVGVIMAAFFAAGVLSQYTMGRLSDRVGRRPVLIGGLAAFAAGTLAFLIQPAPLFDMIFRALQGGGAGATTAVAAAVVADNVPSEWQGRAFGAC